MATPDQPRKIVAPKLEVPELQREPQWRTAWREPGELQRALAHLAAVCGSVSKLLGATPLGALRVCVEAPLGYQALVNALGHLSCRIEDIEPGKLRRDANGIIYQWPRSHAQIPALDGALPLSGPEVKTVDFGSNGNRVTRIQSDGSALRLYDSTSPGGKHYNRGFYFPAEYCEIPTAYRYLDIDVPAGVSGTLVYMTWQGL